MMAWGIHFPHAAITLPKCRGRTFHHASGHVHFPERRINPRKGNAPEDQFSRGAAMLMLGMIRLKMTKAAR